MKKPEASFTKLNIEDAQQAIEDLLRARSDVHLWKKGTTVKEIFRVYDVQAGNFEIILEPVSKKTEMLDSELIVNFELDKRQFFSTATLIYDENKQLYFLNLAKDIFKCERRRNFRISKDMVSELSFEINQKSFEIIDVSVSGISLVIPSESLAHFLPESLFHNATLNFEGVVYSIPLCKVIYNKEYYKDEESKIAGMEFFEVPHQEEEQLFIAVNNALFSYMHKE